MFFCLGKSQKGKKQSTIKDQGDIQTAHGTSDDKCERGSRMDGRRCGEKGSRKDGRRCDERGSRRIEDGAFLKSICHY